MLAGSRRGGEHQPPLRGRRAVHGAIATVRASHANAPGWAVNAVFAPSDDPRW